MKRLLPHRYDAVMISYHDGIGPSATREVDRRPCSTKLGADFCRRFRLRRGPTMSMLAGNYTLITKPGETDNVEIPAWQERVWDPLYWLRNRWDGLRYGYDREMRR